MIMKYLIVIATLLIASNALGEWRFKRTYSLSETMARDARQGDLQAISYLQMRFNAMGRHQEERYHQSLITGYGGHSGGHTNERYNNQYDLDNHPESVSEWTYVIDYGGEATLEYRTAQVTGEERYSGPGMARFNGPQHNYYYMENNEPSPWTKKVKKWFK